MAGVFPPFPAFLDPEDLSSQPTFPAQPALWPQHDDLQVSFRHSGWTYDRRRVWVALNQANSCPDRLDRFRNCGTGAWVARSDLDPRNLRVFSNHCHDRFCRPCAAFRGRVISENLRTYLADRPYRFLTLTIKTDGLTLPQSLTKLTTSFARLRRSQLWLDRVTGGCAIIEVKPHSRSDGWHPHLHCLLEGKYLPQQPLRKLWHTVTGDSYILDIRSGTNPESAASYITKYIAKPFDSAVIRCSDRLRQAVEALHRKRLLTTFGTWRGVPLTLYRPSGTWTFVCLLSQLLLKATRGNTAAIQLVQTLAAQEPYNSWPNPRNHDPPYSPNEPLLWPSD